MIVCVIESGLRERVPSIHHQERLHAKDSGQPDGHSATIPQLSGTVTRSRCGADHTRQMRVFGRRPGRRRLAILFGGFFKSIPLRLTLVALPWFRLSGHAPHFPPTSFDFVHRVTPSPTVVFGLCLVVAFISAAYLRGRHLVARCIFGVFPSRLDYSPSKSSVIVVHRHGVLSLRCAWTLIL